MIIDVHAHPVSRDLIRDQRNLSMMDRRAACHGHPFGIDEVANRHPDLKIIAAHLGVPWLLETIAVAVRHPNVYLDISALPAVENRAVGPALTLCVDRGLTDRLLFGSDFPLVDPAAYARRVNSFGPGWLARRLAGLSKITPSAREAILGGNAARLLNLSTRG